MRTSRAATATTKESIAEKLAAKIETKKQARAKSLAEFTSEKANAKRKIEALQAEQDNADTPGAYKMNAEQIHEQEDYIKFLDKRAQVERTTPLISKEEYKEIENELAGENERLLDAYAPEILKKFNELMQLMSAYTSDADELQDVLNTAQKAHFGHTLGGHFFHTLKTKTPDELGFFKTLCQGFFDRNNMINEVKADKTGVSCYVDTEKARLYSFFKRNKQGAGA